MSIESTIKLAETELGVTEFPKDSNKVKYNTEYYGYEASGQWYPWCVTFLWWIFKHSGEQEAFYNAGRTASCSALKTYYTSCNRWVTSDFKKGDIVLMNFSGGKSPEHCGLVVDVRSDYIVTIEGNTSPGIEGSQDNGGCVAKKYRYAKNIVGACRPKYSKEAAQMKKDYSGHWAEKEIDWVKEKGIMVGYPNGDFGPDTPMTRAEMATVMKRFYGVIAKEKLS